MPSSAGRPREIVRAALGEEIDDVRERFVRGLRTVASILDVSLASVANECLGNLRHRQDQVRTAGGDGVPRHAVESRLLWVLHYDEPAILFDRLQSETASLPVPERIAQMARSPQASARERREKSKGMRAP